MQIVLNSAYAIRETRLQAIATGRIIPGVNDHRSSGVFNADFSDTSSISSTGSGSRFRKLRDTTDMARASLDSLRKGSKESLDDLFKRGLNLSRASNSEDMDRKRASTGDMTRSLSQKFGFVSNSLAAKVRRASSVRSINNPYTTSQEEQIHRDWLLANQLNESQLQQQHHIRQNSISSNASSTTTSTTTTNTRTSSLMNRFSQFVSNKSVTPYSSSALPPHHAGDEKHVNGLTAREMAQQTYRGYV